jgi:OOP family OmpA-OmpF porin
VLFEEEPDGERQPLVLRGVNFELDEAILTSESFTVLEEVAASLVANSEVVVEVSGHTDSTGDAERNQALSLARAEAVRDFLVSRGVAPGRLVARGYGSDQPVASNATEDGRAANRRVELRLVEN